MVLTEHDRTNFRFSNVCHICEKPLNSDTVRDHCHVTGKYIGAAHYKCNIQRSYNHYDIPMFIHNCKGYDSHLIINNLKDFNKKQKYW